MVTLETVLWSAERGGHSRVSIKQIGKLIGTGKCE